MQPEGQFIDTIIQEQNITFIGSVDQDGWAMLRPRKREVSGSFIFPPIRPATKCGIFLQNEKTCVYVYGPMKFQGALLKGHMELLEEHAHKEMLWAQGDKFYYPKGVTDPDYCVLRFTASKCRIYSDFQSTDFVLGKRSGSVFPHG